MVYFIRPVAPRLLEPTKQSRHARLLDGSGGTHARRDAHRRRRPERPRRAAAARCRRLRLRLLLRLLPGRAGEHKSLKEHEAGLHHLKGKQTVKSATLNAGRSRSQAVAGLPVVGPHSGSAELPRAARRPPRRRRSRAVALPSSHFDRALRPRVAP
eukprot:scaffold26918_cov63-Phaeocystis_antarctica.AAC.1